MYRYVNSGVENQQKDLFLACIKKICESED